MSRAICHSRDREAWLEARQNYVTASDVATVMGVNRFKTPLQLYLEKLGLAPPFEGNEATEWGLILERPILEEYAKRTGRKVKHASELTCDMYVSEGIPWLACTVDGMHTGDLGTHVEVKTAGAYAASQWDDGVPEGYVIQCNAQMIVMGTGGCTIVALLAGQKMVWCDLDRDKELCARIIDATRDFHRRVELGRRHLAGEDVEPDPPSPGPTDADALTALYPDVDEGSVVILGQDEIAIDDAIAERNEEIARLKALNDADKNLIRAALGSAEKGILPGGVGAWTNKATKSGRVLRRVKG